MTKLILHLGKDTKMILDLRYYSYNDFYIITNMYMKPYYGGDFDLSSKAMVFFNALTHRNSSDMTSHLYALNIKVNRINYANHDIDLIDIDGTIINRFDNISPHDIEYI